MMERFSKRNVSCSRNVIALTMEGQRKNIVMERKRVSEAEVERKKTHGKICFPEASGAGLTMLSSHFRLKSTPPEHHTGSNLINASREKLTRAV